MPALFWDFTSAIGKGILRKPYKEDLKSRPTVKKRSKRVRNLRKRPETTVKEKKNYKGPHYSLNLRKYPRTKLKTKAKTAAKTWIRLETMAKKSRKRTSLVRKLKKKTEPKENPQRTENQ